MVVDPTGGDWLISAGGAAAGMIIVSAFRQVVIACVLIALALVPAAALIGARLAAGQTTLALEALWRVAFDMLVVLVLGGAVIYVKQRLTHHNRPPLI